MTQDSPSEPIKRPHESVPAVSNDADIGVHENSGQVAGTVDRSQLYSFGEIHGSVYLGGQSTAQDRSQQNASSKKKEIPPLLPYLADRSEQEFKLGRFIQHLYQKRSTRPLIIVVHGDEYQCDLKFIERLRERTLPEMLANYYSASSDEIVVEELPLDWPDIELPEAENLDEISARISMDLARKVFRKDPYASLEKINQTFVDSLTVKMICTRLLPSVWKKSRVKVLEKLLEFWTTRWPDLAVGQELVVCISVQYQATQPEPIEKFGLGWLLGLFKRWKKAQQRRQEEKLNQAIRDEIKAVTESKFHNLKDPLGIVLPELESVECQHVEDWVNSEARDFVGDADVQKLIDAIKRLYETLDEPALSMSQLSAELIHLLNSDLDQLRELT